VTDPTTGGTDEPVVGEPVPAMAAPTGPPRVRRAPVFIAIAAALLAGGVIDRAARPAVEPSDATALAMPIAPPPTSLSSTWFCAGGTAQAGGTDGVEADASVVVANPGDRALHGAIRVVPSEGEAKSIPLDVGPRARAVARLGDVVAAPYAAALVELDGGEVVVEQQIRGAMGISTAPCASAASERWYLAEGSTARDGANPEDRMLLALYNPFPEDAIVDLSFTHEAGRSVPSDFTGLVVKGGGLRIVNVGAHVRRRAHISTTAVARTGRVVIDRIQQRNGGFKGISLAQAAPAPAEEWYFPEGYVGAGSGEAFHVYNPSATQEAEVSLELALESGAAEPFDLTIAPRARITVDASAEERVPKDVGHAATVLSLNGVPVVAERTIAVGPPSPRGAGVADSLGIPLRAREWVLAAGGTSPSVDEWITIYNPGPADATVTTQVLASGTLLDLEGLSDVTIKAGRRLATRIPIQREDLPLLVQSSTPVVVERGIYLVGSPGIALSSGIPSR
jgi:hypothetical protein